MPKMQVQVQRTVDELLTDIGNRELRGIDTRELATKIYRDGTQSRYLGYEIT